MAHQFSATVRNNMLTQLINAIGASGSLEVRSGAAPATVATVGSGTVGATINLPASPFGSPSGGAVSFAGTWQDASADATITAAHFRVYSSQVTKDNTTCVWQGTVTATGGGGDMTVDTTSFIATQPFNITALTLTAPGA